MERDGKVGVINIKEKCFSKHNDFEQILVIIFWGRLIKEKTGERGLWGIVNNAG